MPHQLFLTSRAGAAFPVGGQGGPSALGVHLAEHPPGVVEPLPYNSSVPLAEAWGAYEGLVGGALARIPCGMVFT